MWSQLMDGKSSRELLQADLQPARTTIDQSTDHMSTSRTSAQGARIPACTGPPHSVKKQALQLPSMPCSALPALAA